MMLETETTELPDEPSPAVPPELEQGGEDRGADTSLPEIAPLGPPLLPEEGEGDENYGISAYACMIGI
jgi:hypothetical protein